MDITGRGSDDATLRVFGLSFFFPNAANTTKLFWRVCSEYIMGPLPSPHPATITSAMSCAAPTTDVKVSLAPVVAADWDRAPTSPFPQLPSFETATQTMDTSKLPSYTQSKSTRYHPYTRWIPALVDGTGIDRLFVCSSLLVICSLLTYCIEHHLRRGVH